jgi:uncharacterized glyoxalase superfamily protein PhnB
MPAFGCISPALYYRDAHAAIEFLERAFGFRRRLVVPDDGGGVAHAELTFRDSVLMVGTAKPSKGWVSPLDLSGVNQTLSVTVEDADAHYARAVAAGARIIREPVDESYGGRGYEAADLEGNVWYFGTYVPGAWWDGKTPSRPAPAPGVRTLAGAVLPEEEAAGRVRVRPQSPHRCARAVSARSGTTAALGVAQRAGASEEYQRARRVHRHTQSLAVGDREIHAACRNASVAALREQSRCAHGVLANAAALRRHRPEVHTRDEDVVSTCIGVERGGASGVGSYADAASLELDAKVDACCRVLRLARARQEPVRLSRIRPDDESRVEQRRAVRASACVARGTSAIVVRHGLREIARRAHAGFVHVPQ